MNVEVKPGRYVIAVSGGVDSMVLLDLLAKQAKSSEPKAQSHKNSSFQPSANSLELAVAHFNHGIRADSAHDEQFVAEAARRLKLGYEAGYGDLGPNASEETARQARYQFLTEVKKNQSADAIITAHHRDDMVETAILNLLRGTGRKGLVAISSNKDVIRPLLPYSKEEIIGYAKHSGIDWREDSSNLDNSYLRNYVRNKILKRLTAEQKTAIILNIDKVAEIERILNPKIAKISQYICDRTAIDRSKFINLPVDLGNELIIYWLRQNNMLNYDEKAVKRINNALRTSRGGTVCPVKQDLKVEISRKTACFSNTV